MVVRNHLGQFEGSKYKKIDGVWYKGICQDCGVLLKGHKSKRCKVCFGKSISGVKPKGAVKIGFYNKKFPGSRLDYARLHARIRYRFGSRTECYECGSKSNLHWANYSGDYNEYDKSDWIELCAKCHKAFDLGRLLIERRSS